MCVLETSDSTLLPCPHCDHFSGKWGHFLAKNPPYTFSGQALLTHQYCSCWSPSVATQALCCPWVLIYEPLDCFPHLHPKPITASQETGQPDLWTLPGACVQLGRRCSGEPHAPRCAENAGGGQPFPGGWDFKIKWDKIHIWPMPSSSEPKVLLSYTRLEWILTCVSSSSKLFFRKGAKNII